MSLHPFQQEGKDALREAFRQYRKVMYQLPTGGGKTHVAADLIKSAVANGWTVPFVVDKIELLEQASRRLDAEGIDHGVIQGSHPRYLPHLPVQVCTVQTLARRRQLGIIGAKTLVVIDEAHVLHKWHRQVMEEWSNVRFLGLSATPWAPALGLHFEFLVVGPTYRWMIDNGYLVDADVYAPSEPDLSRIRVRGGDYEKNELGERVRKPALMGNVVEEWIARGENRPTLLFATDIAHSKAMVDLFRAEGVPAAHIDAYTDRGERREIMQAYEGDEIRILSSVDILSKGYDHPKASCGILARPTKSKMLYFQQVGRVLRTFEGKGNAIILDHAGNTARHGFVTDPLQHYLSTDERREAEVRVTERLPSVCPKCKWVKQPGEVECPRCGYYPEYVRDVAAASGTLTKVKKGKVREWTDKDRQAWCGMFNAYAAMKGYKHGWAAHQFKEKFGEFPPREWGSIKRQPSAEFNAWMKHIHIKRAKSGRKDNSGSLGRQA